MTHLLNRHLTPYTDPIEVACVLGQFVIGDPHSIGIDGPALENVYNHEGVAGLRRTLCAAAPLISAWCNTHFETLRENEVCFDHEFIPELLKLALDESGVDGGQTFSVSIAKALAVYARANGFPALSGPLGYPVLVEMSFDALDTLSDVLDEYNGDAGDHLVEVSDPETQEAVEGRENDFEHWENVTNVLAVAIPAANSALRVHKDTEETEAFAAFNLAIGEGGLTFPR